jgi:hypothetical protein
VTSAADDAARENNSPLPPRIFPLESMCLLIARA